MYFMEINEIMEKSLLWDHSPHSQLLLKFCVNVIYNNLEYIIMWTKTLFYGQPQI